MTEKKWAEDIARYYKAGLWTAEMVQNAVTKGKITQEDADVILNEKSE